MFKEKFVFDKETLTYKLVKLTGKQKIALVSKYAVLFIAVSMVFNIGFSYFFDTPKEKRYKEEQVNILFNYKLLDNNVNALQKELHNIQQRDDNLYRPILEISPIPATVREAGYGGVAQDKFQFLKDNVIGKTSKSIEVISRQLNVQVKSYEEVLNHAKNKEKLLACKPAIVPITNGLRHLVSGFGYRMHPIFKVRKMHTGVDIVSPKGTPIYASGDGIVMEPPGFGTGYGIRVMIDHGFGYQTMYAHLSRTAVKPGDIVKRGQIIGYVGNTGWSVSPHLHYEVIKNGEKVNPVNFFSNDLSPEEYEEVLEEAERADKPLS